MIYNQISKFARSLAKLVLPLIFKMLILLKINRRVINFLKEKSYNSNNIYDFSGILDSFLKDDKIISLDIGAQGGFNSDNFFKSDYNDYFKPILIEPISSEAEKLSKNDKYLIKNGIWSEKIKKKLFILGNRLGSSSMYEPDQKNFDIHNIKEKDFKNFKVTETKEIECDTIQNSLEKLNIDKIDYLKIDTQGAEYEIFKGIGKYRPLLIKTEVHIFSMYKGVSNWARLLNLLYDLNYITIDWKEIGKHNTRAPAEMDMILIPNFNNDIGKKLIIENEKKFISLMLIFGHLNLLKLIIKRLNLNAPININNFEDKYFK